MRTPALLSALLVSGSLVQAQTTIQWWHAMTGPLNDKVNEIAAKFNASQSEFKVVPVYKGNYDETMAAGIAAFRAKEPPAILQVFEVGTATMMNAKGAIKPVAQVMKDAGEPFNPKNYIQAVAGYYTSAKGDMLSFPFNSSTTVLYYNKDAFKKAGLDPSKPPKTWPEMFAYARKIKDVAHMPAFTTDWQCWTQLESFSAWHNTPFATKDNGFGGTDARLTFNSPLHVQHIANLQKMVQEGEFSYAGRKSEGQAKFYSGEVAMFTGSSSALASVRQNSKFSFGVAPLPYYPDAKGAPQNTIIGGASLWIMSGRPAAEYKGVAKFFGFLSRPEVQADWHQASGYLPCTLAAYELTKKSGFYEKNPGADVSVQAMVVKVTAKTRGVRLGYLPQIRTIVDEELEGVWAGKKTAKEALDAAVARGNEQLERFQKVASD